MIEFYRQLLPLLDAPTRRRLAFATAAMVGLAVLEGLALVVMVPLLEILSAPDLQSSSANVSAVSDLLGNPSAGDVAVVLGAVTLGIYVVKSVAAMVVLRWTTSFALAEEATTARRLMVAYLRAPYADHLRRNTSEFVRTPKHRVEAQGEDWKARRYRGSTSFVPYVELGLALYFTAMAYYAVTSGIFGTLPFILLFQLGFFYTGAMSIFQDYSARLELFREQEA